MRLYSGTSAAFIEDTTHNQIAGKLEDAFFRAFRYRPSPSEVDSWRNSLRALSDAFRVAELTDHGVLLEYQLPLSSKRLDCLVCGRTPQGEDHAVIIELKQWSKCEPSFGPNEVVTWLNGRQRDVLHPSAQVRQYRNYLEDSHTAFYEGDAPIQLHSCAYLHNYYPERDDVLFDNKFYVVLQDSPLFAAGDFNQLTAFLNGLLPSGDGLLTLQRIEKSKFRPSKKLMNHVSTMIKTNADYVLLDEQLVVYDKILVAARDGFRSRRKSVIVVEGGPGTGKSVIAINVMADLMRMGINAEYATGSRAFTQTLRRIVGSRAGVKFRYFNSYGEATPNDVDVLICDEAHRIRESSIDRFTPKDRRTGKPQIEELIGAAKVSVFFIDDRQVVRPVETGSIDLIRQAALASDCDLAEYRLEVQFRCAGSEGFVNWVNNTLGIERTPNVIWQTDEQFDFRIFDTVEALDAAIRGKAQDGFNGRLVAGFCWPWSDPKADGSLMDDVQIGGFQRPWNAKSDAGKLARDIPKEVDWATDPNGINQVGCVYTAQGFEFDYVGVIFGSDLVYRFDDQSWVGQPGMSHDAAVKRAGDGFTEYVKNTYRVLLSRGLSGCYVFFQDRETELFVRSRIESVDAGVPTMQAMEMTEPASAQTALEPFRRLFPEEVRPYENAVPLYPLEVAAGAFHEARSAEEVEWVELPEAFRPSPELFVAKVVGESMNRRIPNGSWCLFRLNPAGSREGRIVLAEHREIDDPDTGGHYTVKRYTSERRPTRDDSWRHKAIVLRPESTDPRFEPIVLSPEDASDLRIVAEFIAVLG